MAQLVFLLLFETILLYRTSVKFLLNTKGDFNVSLILLSKFSFLVSSFLERDLSHDLKV